MALPFQNCTIDIWDNLIPAPGVPPNQNAVAAAILRPYYPIGADQTPQPGIPLIYRVLINGSFFFSRPMFSTGGGFSYNVFFKLNPNPFLTPQVFRIIGVSPRMNTLGNAYWYCYAIFWGPQP